MGEWDRREGLNRIVKGYFCCLMSKSGIHAPSKEMQPWRGGEIARAESLGTATMETRMAKEHIPAGTEVGPGHLSVQRLCERVRSKRREREAPHVLRLRQRLVETIPSGR